MVLTGRFCIGLEEDEIRLFLLLCNDVRYHGMGKWVFKNSIRGCRQMGPQFNPLVIGGHRPLGGRSICRKVDR